MLPSITKPADAEVAAGCQLAGGDLGRRDEKRNRVLERGQDERRRAAEQQGGEPENDQTLAFAKPHLAL